MKIYREIGTGKITENKECSQWFSDLIIQYGKEESIENQWKEIVKEKDKNLRHKKIDAIIEKLEANSTNNGFIQSKVGINIDCWHGFKVDDREIYYIFFKNLIKNCEELDKMGKTNYDGFVMYVSIRQTLDDYYGKRVENAYKIRKQLTEIDEDENGCFVVSSIKVLKGQGCAMCAEKASVAHNLWLICGKKSYYISSKTIKYKGKELSDGHAFCVVENAGKFKVFDAELENYGPIDFNPIENVKNNLPIEIKDKNIDITYVVPVGDEINKD